MGEKNASSTTQCILIDETHPSHTENTHTSGKVNTFVGHEWRVVVNELEVHAFVVGSGRDMQRFDIR
jgi:hypothetical protein